MKVKCYQCVIFHNSKYKKSDGTRYCLIAKKSVLEGTAACDQFVLYHLIWCPRNSNHIFVLACLHRQKTKVAGCINCPAGKATKKLTEKGDTDGDTKPIKKVRKRRTRQVH